MPVLSFSMPWRQTVSSGISALAPTHTGTAGQIISENCSGTLTPTDTIRLCLVDDTHYHIVNHPALTLQYCFTDSLDSNQADSLCSFNLR